MQKGIHTDLHNVTFVCACGNTFTGTSTKAGDTIRLDICSNCHPQYTGNIKAVDTSGRVEKFKKKYNV